MIHHTFCCRRVGHTANVCRNVRPPHFLLFFKAFLAIFFLSVPVSHIPSNILSSLKWFGTLSTHPISPHTRWWAQMGNLRQTHSIARAFFKVTSKWYSCVQQVDRVTLIGYKVMRKSFPKCAFPSQSGTSYWYSMLLALSCQPHPTVVSPFISGCSRHDVALKFFLRIRSEELLSSTSEIWQRPLPIL